MASHPNLQPSSSSGRGSTRSFRVTSAAMMDVRSWLVERERRSGRMCCMCLSQRKRCTHMLTMGYVRAARIMVATMPYSNWPLHLKLYSEEAVKAWEYYEKLQASRYPLPPTLATRCQLTMVNLRSRTPIALVCLET
jgi:hypothetical protein